MPSYPKIGGDTGTCDGRHFAIMQAIKYRIVQLGLSGFNNDRIEVVKQPLNRGIMQAIGKVHYGDDGTAAMVISPAGDRLGKRKNNARDIIYASLITVFEASNLDNREGLDTHLGWRDAITDEFDDYPFPEVTGGQRVTIAPGAFNPLPTWLKNYDAQVFTVSVTMCVNRPWPS